MDRFRKDDPDAAEKAQRLAEIEHRWTEATPGPWYNDPDTHAGRVWVQRVRNRWMGGHVTDCEPLFNVRGPDEYEQRAKDAAAVAAAPEDVAWLIARVREVDAIEQPRLPTRSEVVERLAKVDKLEAAILDIDAHATALGTDEHGFNAIGYAISIGCLHRALGLIGHPAAPCSGDHEHCPKCGMRPFKGLGGWDSVACQICGGTGRPSSTYRATEDPEPEVDPAQVETLVALEHEAFVAWERVKDENRSVAPANWKAKYLLASGRVQVTP